MTVREWTHADKAKWGAGPWASEPDKVQWVDEASGLDCLIHRSPLGAWCGYVGVTEGHPSFGIEYDHVDADVHGGLTYSDFCQDTTDESHGICHVPEPGRPHRVWWLGFDCSHLGDFVPGMAQYGRYRLPESDEVYRDRAYVESEVRSLASQLASRTTAAAR